MNINDNEITFIICNRGGNRLFFCIDKMKTLYPYSKFIIVNQDDELPFMRGQLFNIGVKFCNTKYICLIDNDIFFNDYIDLISLYNENNVGMLQPFDSLQQVNIKNNMIIYKQIDKIADGSKGGITFMSKQNFIDCNGFSNLMIGWGYEDGEFYTRNKYRNGYMRLCNICSHISHKRRNNTNIKNTEINKEFYYHRKTVNDTLDGYYQTTFNLIYDININEYIRYIVVNNISVCDDYQYKDLLSKHYE